MVKRAFWIALGATVGVLVVTKGSKALRKVAPAALLEGASALPGTISGRLQGFADDVRMAAAERELELYRVLGVDIPDPGE